MSREQALTAVGQILRSEGSVSAVVIMRNDGVMLADGRTPDGFGADGQYLEVPDLMSFPSFGVHVFFERLASCSATALYKKTSRALYTASRSK